MSLSFILGKPGSGKSYHLYNALIRLSEQQKETAYFVIVPEQFTMQTQADIVRLHPRHGTMDIDIVSFPRLAYRIFEELGVKNPILLDDLGKSLLLRKAAGRLSGLKLLHKNIDKPGFVDELKSTLSEFYQYQINEDILNRLKQETIKRPLLNQKMEDLLTIYQGFKQELGDTAIPSEEILNRLCEVLPDSQRMKNSVIVLDGFTGFTPSQYKVLTLLMRLCKSMTITLTLGSGEAMDAIKGEHHLFGLSRQTYDKLRHLAKDNHVEIGEDLDLNLNQHAKETFSKVPDLNKLESKFLRYSFKPQSEEPQAIFVHKTLNPKEELKGVAGRIFTLVSEHGYRYRDIAVVTGDLNRYEPLAREIFSGSGIPYFIDSGRSLLHNPLSALIRGALTIVDKDFSYESVFAYLKCGLVSLEPNDMDVLENYLIATGIRGFGKWSQPFTRKYRHHANLDLNHLNEIREQILQPLIPLRQVLKDKNTLVTDYIEAIRQFLTIHQVEDQLQAWVLEFEQIQDESMAQEYGKAYRLVDELLEKLDALMGEESCPLKDFIDILNTGFEEIKAGIIPSCLDRLILGDMERTRLGNIKALFLIGMNEGVVPKPPGDGGILSDLDRQHLKSLDVELAPTIREQSFIQKFYIYLTLTKPTRRLYLSYCVMDQESKGLLPSYYLRSIYKIFPSLKEKTETAGLNWLTTEESGRHLLASGLCDYREGESDPCWQELYSWFYEKEEWKDSLNRLVDAAFFNYREESLGHQVSNLLYGGSIKGSVTRLEKHAACAYAQFLQYGLQLAERETYSFEAVDMGNIYHRAIETFFQRIKEEGLSAFELDEVKENQLVKESVQLAIVEYDNEALSSSGRNLYLENKIGKVTRRTVWALLEQMKRGDFVPSAFEVSFSSRELDKMKFPLTDQENMQLKGKIDRIDTKVTDDKVYVKIVDYKSGQANFDLVSIYYGLQLQLVLYLDAAMELEQKIHADKKVLPGGVFYYHIDDPFVEGSRADTEEAIERKLLKALRVNGLVNDDLEVIRGMDRDLDGSSDVIPVTLKADTVVQSRSQTANEKRFHSLCCFVEEKIQKMGQEIAAGYVPVSPYKKGDKTACDYCQYQSVCGFEPRLDGYAYRKLIPFKAEDIWQQIEKEDQSIDQENSKDENDENLE